MIVFKILRFAQNDSVILSREAAKDLLRRYREIALDAELVDGDPVLKNRVDSVGEFDGADSGNPVDGDRSLRGRGPTGSLGNRLRRQLKQIRLSGHIVSGDNPISVRQTERHISL